MTNASLKIISCTPILLDLFCGAGGCSKGYVDAGFKVVGVDIKCQKNYPYEFIQADALEYVRECGHEYDAIHASPPCQAYSMAGQQWRAEGREYVDLVADTRKVLQIIRKPYVIENVPGAPLIDPIKLNGAMFGLKVRRVRLFECSFDVPFVLLPDDAPAPFRTGRPLKEGEAITPVGHFSNVPFARQEMQISWMTGQELTQAIPPAYTNFIGGHLMDRLNK